MSASVPPSLKDLRACKICSLIKTLDQFDEEGCDNCDDFLRLKGNRDKVFECTSSNFDGLISMMDPTDSWVARWQRIDSYVRGMYAISVSGELPEAIKRSLREKDIQMTLIEGIGDDVITLLFILFSVIIIIISWLSTNVREFAFPANLLVIERRSRRLYTASLNGNLISTQRLSSTSSNATPSSDQTNNINSNGQNDPARINSTPSTTTNTNQNRVEGNDEINQTTNSSGTITSTRRPSSSSSLSLERTQELELVNEIVEQALVDNLLDGEYYSTNDIELIQNHHHHHHFHAQRNNTNAIITTNSTATTSTNSILNDNNQELNENVLKSSSERIDNSGPTDNGLTTAPSSTNENLINILIRFVNEKEMKIQAKPNDTILILKKTHFGQELATNKIVRFIYQGQFLCDKNTVKSYNIKDQTTIHCHITTKPNQQQQTVNNLDIDASNSLGNLSQEHSSSGLRLREVNFSNSDTIQTVNNVNNNNNNSNNNSNSINSSNDTNPMTTTIPRINPNQANAAIINIDLNNLLLPFFAALLGVSWYFRVNFKHFFSPLSTLILVIFTFIYALFLFNNIHSTSSIAANNFMMHSRIMRRRQIRAQQEAEQQIVQPVTTEPIPTTQN